MVEGSSRLKLKLYQSTESACGVKVEADDVEYTLDGDYMIEKVTSYRFEGKVFDSVEHVVSYVENEIGKIIYSTASCLADKDAIAVFDAIVRNRKRLAELLTVTYKDDEQRTVNIFDSN